MDVIQVLKEDHSVLFGKAQSLSGLQTKKDLIESFPAFFEALSCRLALEKNYLYPEIDGIFTEADVLTAAEKRNGQLKRLLDKLNKEVAEKKFDLATLRPELLKLEKQLELHFASEDSVILPKMRRLIATEDREELAYVFEDARQQLVAKSLKTKDNKVRA